MFRIEYTESGEDSMFDTQDIRKHAQLYRIQNLYQNGAPYHHDLQRSAIRRWPAEPG
jgi:hypothetical protein